ncbi:MAG TPA: cellulase family glycosylhydrolase [Oculatellaceae cyanobacterium]|jgi:hypothetical protein
MLKLSRLSVAVIGFWTLQSTTLAKDPLPDTTIPVSAGVAAHYNSYAYNPAYTDKTFDAVAQAHFSLVRFVPDWQHIEKQKGIYDFSTVDWLTGMFTSRGIRPVLCLGLNNPLYKVNSRINTPEQREAFGRFVDAMVRHYKGRRVIWEIWNEPNISHFWRPAAGENLTLQQQVSEYLTLLDYVLPIIRNADPEALIIAPGAANYNTPWLQTALKSGLLSRVDGLSVHPYQGKERPELVIAQHQQVQGWIPSEYRNKPIFFTEWGYSTGLGSYEVSESLQAAYAQRQYMLSLMLGIRGNFVYSLADASIQSPCQTSQACFGLFTKASGTPKPVYAALKQLHESLTGYRFSRRIAFSEPTIYLLEFKAVDGRVKYAIWSSKNDARVQVTLPNKKTVTADYTVQVF